MYLENIEMCLLLLREEVAGCAADGGKVGLQVEFEEGSSGDDIDPLKKERIRIQRWSIVVITFLHLYNENHTFFIDGGISNQPSTILSRL